MAVTTFQPGLHSTYTVSNGGNIVDANQLDLFVNWANALENGIGRTPLLDAIGFGEELNQRRVYFGQSYNLDIDAELGAATVATGMTWTLASGHGARYKKFDVLGLFASATALEPVEISIVESIAGDVVTFSQRGAAGTAASAVTTAGVVVNATSLTARTNNPSSRWRSPAPSRALKAGNSGGTMAAASSESRDTTSYGAE